ALHTLSLHDALPIFESIQRDVRWLGFEYGDRVFYASDYFEQLYELAVGLIRDGKAYVDSSPPDEIRRLRGTLTEPGQPSPFRDRDRKSTRLNSSHVK